jgi:hypothetical protein
MVVYEMVLQLVLCLPFSYGIDVLLRRNVILQVVNLGVWAFADFVVDRN